MQEPQYEINEAAKIIQKHWRGYYQRQHIIKYNGKIMVEYEEETDESEYEDSNESSSGDEDYLDDINENDDLAGVFNVTGVTNAQEDNEFDYKIIPADAFNAHKRMIKSNEILRSNSEKRFNTARNDEKPKPANAQMVEQTKKETKKINFDGRNKAKQSQSNQNQKTQVKTKSNANTNYMQKSKNQAMVSPGLENLNQSLNNNTNSPINIKTYMCD